MSMPTLKNIEYLKKVLSRLNAEKPAAEAQQGRTIHQEREGDLIKRLNLEAFSQEGKARTLITGQIGVGKSSELWHFYQQRLIESPRTGFWVFCDLEKEEHPERCGATGVFLTMLRDCWGATKGLKDRLKYMKQERRRVFYKIRDEILERLIDWLKGERIVKDDKVVFRFGGMDFPVWLRNKDKALALLLGKAAQHEAVSDRAERFGLVPDRLVTLMNRLFGWLTEIHSGIPPLIILDHVDKIRDESSAREVLIEIIPQWQRINASIIMSAPYEYTLGPMRNSVESYWGNPMMIYPLNYPDLEVDAIDPFYKKIVESSGIEDNISADSLRVLAHFSGGIPRTFVQLLVQALKESHLAGHDQIECSDAQAVVFNAERAYQDYGADELRLLGEIADKKIGLGSASTLLRSPIGLLVMAPEKGEHPLKVHPLAERVLDRYRDREKQEGD
jgi:hypothetical protein